MKWCFMLVEHGVPTETVEIVAIQHYLCVSRSGPLSTAVNTSIMSFEICFKQVRGMFKKGWSDDRLSRVNPFQMPLRTQLTPWLASSSMRMSQ